SHPLATGWPRSARAEALKDAEFVQLAFSPQERKVLPLVTMGSPSPLSLMVQEVRNLAEAVSRDRVAALRHFLAILLRDELLPNAVAAGRLASLGIDPRETAELLCTYLRDDRTVQATDRREAWQPIIAGLEKAIRAESSSV